MIAYSWVLVRKASEVLNEPAKVLLTGDEVVLYPGEGSNERLFTDLLVENDDFRDAVKKAGGREAVTLLRGPFV